MIFLLFRTGFRRGLFSPLPHSPPALPFAKPPPSRREAHLTLNFIKTAAKMDGGSLRSYLSVDAISAAEVTRPARD